MHKEAIEKAKDRIESAKAHLKSLEASKDYKSSRRHWYDFLTASNNVFSVLQQGAKGSSKSDAWFAKRRQERRQDPLLCYMQHARNADEHNVPSVTALDRERMVFHEGDKAVASVDDMVGNKGIFHHPGDKPPDLPKIDHIRIYPERAKLIRVRDRNVDYDPPTEHLGSTIPEVSPLTVARLMLNYVEAMTIEASPSSHEESRRLFRARAWFR
jgi:hypothetical protein